MTSSPSSVLTLGLGARGSPGLLVTLGLGISDAEVLPTSGWVYTAFAYNKGHAAFDGDKGQTAFDSQP